MLNAPLSHLETLVTCYLLPCNSIAGIQQSFVLVEVFFHLSQELNLLLVFVAPCCHTRSPYIGAGKSVSLLAVYGSR